MTSWRSLIRLSWRRWIYDVLKTSDLGHLQDIWFTTSWRRLIYVVLKTSNLGHLKNVWFTTSSGRLIYDVLKTSDLRRLDDVQFPTSWRRLIYDVLKTSVKQRLCGNVAAISIQRRKEWFFRILHCLEYSEIFQVRLVFRYGILYKSKDWFIYDRNLRHERGNHT